MSFLNIDYKILTKLVALRMHKFISKLISSDQSGWVKGRFISANIRVLLDMLEFIADKVDPGLIAFLDFSVSWEFLMTTLTNFNVGS